MSSTAITRRDIFGKYPDVVTVEQFSEMIGVCHKTAYALLKSGNISCFKIGRVYRIPKVSVIRFLNEKNTFVNAVDR